jgi:hypothetical protein
MSGGQPGTHDASSLRLPVPFFDLLMVLLVTCLVFVAPLPSEESEIQAMDVAIAQGKSGSGGSQALLPVIPRETATGWAFATSPRGEAVTPQALGERAKNEGRKIVLVVPPATALQDFVDMQAALSTLNIPFALAIRNKESAP